MISTHTIIDVKNLCSRKLWDILVSQKEQPLSAQQASHIEAELLERQHYLTELHHLREKMH